MIRLQKDGIGMEVRTDVQASAFLRAGWVLAEEVAEKKDEEKPKYTKTDINRMASADLKKLASELGVTGNTGGELKKAIIGKLNL